MNASSKFMAGPAAATNTRPRRSWRNRCGLIGISPHAMPAIAKKMSDMRPMCTMGFMVIWPISRGVLSPLAIAAQPCASSCSTMEKITQNAQLKSKTMPPLSYAEWTHQFMGDRVHAWGGGACFRYCATNGGFRGGGCAVRRLNRYDAIPPYTGVPAAMVAMIRGNVSAQ